MHSGFFDLIGTTTDQLNAEYDKSQLYFDYNQETLNFLKNESEKQGKQQKTNVSETQAAELAEASSEDTQKSEKILKKGLGLRSKKISKELSSKSSKDTAYSRRTWTKEEDERLIELIKLHGLNWALISERMGKSRSGKQIRDRYWNNLNPTITRGKWTDEEDSKLFELFKIHGRKWCDISKNLPGRTESMVKNRFHSKFKNYLDDDAKKTSRDCSYELTDNSLNTAEQSAYPQNHVGFYNAAPVFLQNEMNHQVEQNQIKVAQETPNFQNMCGYPSEFIGHPEIMYPNQFNQTPCYGAQQEYNSIPNSNAQAYGYQSQNAPYVDFSGAIGQRYDAYPREDLGFQRISSLEKKFAQFDELNPMMMSGMNSKLQGFSFNNSDKQVEMRTLMARLSFAKNIYLQTLQEIQHLMKR